MAQGAYGERLGRSFNLETPPTLGSRTERGHLIVTELLRDKPGFGFTEPIAPESAYLLGLQLRGITHHELWVDGRSIPVSPIAPNTTHLFDLECNPVCYTNEPFHDLFSTCRAKPLRNWAGMTASLRRVTCIGLAALSSATR